MAEASNTKKEYDTYYAVTSTYGHGHWLAIRNTCFATCLNPLHRFHRVPLANRKLHEDVILDAIDLVKEIILNIMQIYPELSLNVEFDFEEKVGVSIP